MDDLHTIVAVANDAAGVEALSVLAKEHGATGFFSKGDQILQVSDELTKAVEGARAVVVYTSTGEKRSEAERYAAALAMKLGKPVIGYTDAPGGHRRFPHGEWTPYATAMAVLLSRDAEDCATRYPKVHVEATGNWTWDKWWFSKVSRSEARAKMGLADHEYAVLISGHKLPAVTMPAIELVHEALSDDKNHASWRIIVRPHPKGDCPAEAHRAFAEFSNKNRDGNPMVMYLEPTSIPEDGACQGADMIVGEASTAEVGGGILRIPTIAILSDITLNRNPTVFGEREWFWAEQGTSAAVDLDVNSIRHLIRMLMTPEGFAPYKKRMEEVFIRPERPGVALEKMIELIQAHAK